MKLSDKFVIQKSHKMNRTTQVSTEISPSTSMSIFRSLNTIGQLIRSHASRKKTYQRKGGGGGGERKMQLKIHSQSLLKISKQAIYQVHVAWIRMERSLTPLHWPVRHFGHSARSQSIVVIGFLLGSQVTSNLLHWTVRCLRPLPQVTEH